MGGRRGALGPGGEVAGREGVRAQRAGCRGGVPVPVAVPPRGAAGGCRHIPGRRTGRRGAAAAVRARSPWRRRGRSRGRAPRRGRSREPRRLTCPWVGPAGRGSLPGRRGRPEGARGGRGGHTTRPGPARPGAPCAPGAGPAAGLRAPGRARGSGLLLVCVVAGRVESGRGGWCGPAVPVPPGRPAPGRGGRGPGRKRRRKSRGWWGRGWERITAPDPSVCFAGSTP